MELNYTTGYNKHMKNVLLLTILVVLSSCISNDYNPPYKNPLSSVADYMVYYGAKHIDELKQYDLLILQSELYSDLEISELKSAGSIPIAYLSLGEIEKSRWWADRIKDSWLLGKNDIWDSFYIDPGNPGWESLVLELIIPSITQKGFSGLFLDTVDMIDLYPESRTEMVELISRIRKAYPELILVQNRGFNIFSQTAEMLDGILFESMTSSYNFQTESSYPLDQFNLIRSIRRTAEKNGLALFALDYLDPMTGSAPLVLLQRFYKISRQYNYIPLATDISLQKVKTKQED
jgi:uncharacterized protein (TIGR01370 family)